VSTVKRLSSWVISSNLSLLRSVDAVRGRSLRSWFWMLVFPPFKCFTHLRTMLYTCTHFHKHPEVSGEFLQEGFPFDENFNDIKLAKRHIVVGHFVRSDTGKVIQAIDVTRHSSLTQQLIPSSTVLSFVCCSRFACKKRCSWLSVRPSYNCSNLQKSHYELNKMQRMKISKHIRNSYQSDFS